VVIPTLNEARNVGHVLRALPNEVAEVLVVDGGSVDDTLAVVAATRPDARVIPQARRGKGNALTAGLAAATNEWIVMLDADGSMDPAEIPAFLTALDGGADYVKGSRHLAFGGGSQDLTWLRRLGNAALNRFANVLFRTRFTDLCYGYNAVRRSALEALDLPDPHDGDGQRWGDGFEIETLLTLRAIRGGLEICEVPSFERCRLVGESNLRTFRDGARVLWTICRERLQGRWSRPGWSMVRVSRGRQAQRPVAAGRGLTRRG
jgi:glycosyltransferase involved in cell wall biosynthesis